jgi:hypothetical protein
VPLPPTGYLEIERALRQLALGESDGWVAGKLLAVDHPAATKAVALLRQGRSAGSTTPGSDLPAPDFPRVI